MSNLMKKVNQESTQSLDLPIEAPRILALEKIKRPLGYSLPNYISLCATTLYGDVRIQGFGEGSGQIAIAKAIAEATERGVQKHYALKTGQPESSSGWACHTSGDLAIQSAILELIERDVALSNWESNGPFYELPSSLWPTEVNLWNLQKKADLEFSNLRILLSSSSNGACVSALLLNERLNFVSGHASGLDLNSAILSATAECMRAAHAALRLEGFTEVTALHLKDYTEPTSPGTHSLAYAYSKTLPTNIEIYEASESLILNMWENHVAIFSALNRSGMNIQLYHVGDLYVARVRSEQYRPIFWGANKNNREIANLNPHFVG